MIVERGALHRLAEYLPDARAKVFVITTRDVWELHGSRLHTGLIGREVEVLYFPGGEENKRLTSVEQLADGMLAAGADRTSIVIGFGGGIVTDIAGFLAAIFMRGIPVIQIPTTLLAQVDAAVGGKTGVNLAGGKNLMGSFHQPRAVLIDPEVLTTLSEREYRAGLYEVIKHGIIRDRQLFDRLNIECENVLSREIGVVDYAVRESVRIKAEVVSADEKESDLRRILNFGHTVGHALEAETGYTRFLHGEAVAFGMKAATILSVDAKLLPHAEGRCVLDSIERYGPIPSLDGISAERLAARLKSDKKTIQGSVHFVLLEAIGRTRVVSGLDRHLVQNAIEAALHA